MRPEPGHDTGRNALRHALRRDLAVAMKAREPDAVAALRTVIAAIDNAEAVPAPEANQAVTCSHIAGARPGLGAAEAARRNLSDSEQQAVLREQITGYTAEADRYEALGWPDAAARLRAQAHLLSAYRRLSGRLLPVLGPRQGRDGAAKPISAAAFAVVVADGGTGCVGRESSQLIPALESFHDHTGQSITQVATEPGNFAFYGNFSRI